MVGQESSDTGKLHPIRDIIEKLKKSSKFEERKAEILQFNQNNLWQKKGIALIPLKYNHNYFGTRYHVNISVYHDDGSIAVTHGGSQFSPYYIKRGNLLFFKKRYRDGSGDQHEGLPGDCPGARSADGADQSETNQQLHWGQQLRHWRQYGLRVLLLGKRILLIISPLIFTPRPR